MTTFDYLFDIIVIGYSIHLILKFRTMYNKTSESKYKWLSYIFVIVLFLIVLGACLQLINL